MRERTQLHFWMLVALVMTTVAIPVAIHPSATYAQDDVLDDPGR